MPTNLTPTANPRAEGKPFRHGDNFSGLLGATYAAVHFATLDTKTATLGTGEVVVVKAACKYFHASANYLSDK